MKFRDTVPLYPDMLLCAFKIEKQTEAGHVYGHGHVYGYEIGTRLPLV